MHDSDRWRTGSWGGSISHGDFEVRQAIEPAIRRCRRYIAKLLWGNELEALATDGSRRPSRRAGRAGRLRAWLRAIFLTGGGRSVVIGRHG